jgi:hypothetical protein
MSDEVSKIETGLALAKINNTLKLMGSFGLAGAVLIGGIYKMDQADFDAAAIAIRLVSDDAIREKAINSAHRDSEALHIDSRGATQLNALNISNLIERQSKTDDQLNQMQDELRSAASGIQSIQQSLSELKFNERK